MNFLGNTELGPSIFVPRNAEISPVINTPCTIVFPNLVCFANSSFTCRGLVSPIIPRRQLRRSVWKPRSVATGLPLWGAHACSACSAQGDSGRCSAGAYQRRGLQIMGNINSTHKLHPLGFMACFCLQMAGTKEYFESGRCLHLVLPSNPSSLLLPGEAWRNGGTWVPLKALFAFIGS